MTPLRLGLLLPLRSSWRLRGFHAAPNDGSRRLLGGQVNPSLTAATQELTEQ